MICVQRPLSPGNASTSQGDYICTKPREIVQTVLAHDLSVHWTVLAVTQLYNWQCKTLTVVGETIVGDFLHLYSTPQQCSECSLLPQND